MGSGKFEGLELQNLEECNKDSDEDNTAVMIGINGKEIVIDESPRKEGKIDLLNEIKFHSN